MKKYIILGVIVLVMLLAVPAVSADTAKSVTVDGSLSSSLSIECNVGTATFGTLVNQDNYKLGAGTLTVNALRTAWTVSTSTASNPNGFMLKDGTGVNLANQLQQKAPGDTWPVVISWIVSQPQSGTLTSYPYVLDYYQKVVDGDAAGSYWTTVTYTVAATA